MRMYHDNVETVYIVLNCTVQGDPKNGTIFVRLDFIKYQPIFKIISLSESGANL